MNIITWEDSKTAPRTPRKKEAFRNAYKFKGTSVSQKKERSNLFRKMALDRRVWLTNAIFFGCFFSPDSAMTAKGSPMTLRETDVKVSKVKIPEVNQINNIRHDKSHEPLLHFYKPELKFQWFWFFSLVFFFFNREPKDTDCVTHSFYIS